MEKWTNRCSAHIRNEKKMKRLSCYKEYEKVFRCRGKINRPQKFKMTYNSALKIVEENNLIEHENDSYEVVSADSVVNVITKQCFRKNWLPQSAVRI